MLSETAWTVLGATVIGPLVALFILWLKKRLRLIEISPEAKTAVQMSTSTDKVPESWSEAIVALAIEVGELKKRDNAWAMFTWELEHWGLRGWARAPKPHEPMPQRPHRLRPTTDEIPAVPITEEGVDG